MRHRPSRKWLLACWLGLLPAYVVLWYFPYIDFPIRVLTWTVGFLALAGALALAWKFPFARWLLVACYGVALLFLVMPAHKHPDAAGLRETYCKALMSYLGTPYVWGGEGCFGIDCSGFVRKGMEDALAERSLATIDPGALRQALSLYWHDTNARVIGQGYFGRTRLVTSCENLNTLDYAPLQPGDMAVTAGGDHVMAYLGNKTWIAADPGPASVTEFRIPETRDRYFSVPMHIVRWKVLDN